MSKISQNFSDFSSIVHFCSTFGRAFQDLQCNTQSNTKRRGRCAIDSETNSPAVINTCCHLHCNTHCNMHCNMQRRGRRAIRRWRCPWKFVVICCSTLSYFPCKFRAKLTFECAKFLKIQLLMRGGGLGSRPKKMYGERLGDGVEYHLMSPTPRR